MALKSFLMVLAVSQEDYWADNEIWELPRIRTWWLTIRRYFLFNRANRSFHSLSS
jgi:hypothetical protein